MHFRIDNDELLATSSHGKNLPGHPPADHPLGVIRNEERIGILKPLDGKPEQPLRRFPGELRHTLAIEAHDLMAPGDHPRLDGGGTRAVHDDPIALDPGGLKLIDQSLPRRIIADDPHQRSFSAEGPDIGGDVGRSPRRTLSAFTSTTGTGASGESLDTLPQIYSSTMISPRTRS